MDETKRIAASASYVHVIQWLPEDERQTGKELFDWLDERQKAVTLSVCYSAAGVLLVLQEIEEKMQEMEAVPVIHFEAHGLARAAAKEGGFQGPDGRGGREDLLWTQLALPLGRINVASKFNLLLVVAACHGITAMDAIDYSGPGPFAALIGFKHKVDPSRLFSSMKEIYRQLLDGNQVIEDALTPANSELHLSADEELIAISFFDYSTMLLKRYLNRELDPANRARDNQKMVDRLRDEGRAAILEEVDAAFHAMLPVLLQGYVDTWFAYAEIPENRKRLRIDVQALIRERLQSYAR